MGELRSCQQGVACNKIEHHVRLPDLVGARAAHAVRSSRPRTCCAKNPRPERWFPAAGRAAFEEFGPGSLARIQVRTVKQDNREQWLGSLQSGFAHRQQSAYEPRVAGDGRSAHVGQEEQRLEF
ncbi:MAG: hypothetical protein JOZ65_15785 [Chloroflexi bacterium]|nr:hypothetical protein [Chloroflexota bacterium]